MDVSMVYDPSQPDFTGPVLKAASSNSKPFERGPSPVSAKRIAAAHSAQMEATMAAARADYDAKTAELMAELEGARGEKEKTDTDLAYLKASARKERLQWNKERTLLTRKVAEAVARAREAADGLASPQEFLALQQALTSRETTINDLRRALEVKEAQQSKLQFEVACAATAEADVDRLMLRVASLEKELMQESDARIAAEQEAEALSTEVKSLERRLGAAQEAVARAEEEIATCFKDVAKANAEVREAHAAQRHAELWLEKSLAEVDAVTAFLLYERSVANGVDGTCAGAVTTSLSTSMRTPSQQQHPTPRPAFNGTSNNLDEVVTSKREATFATEVAAREGGSSTSHETLSSPPSMPPNQASEPRTTDLDETVPVLFSTVRMRSRVGGGGRGMGLAVEEVAETATTDRDWCYATFTPTVLFGELEGEGGSATRKTWGGLESSVASKSDATAVENKAETPLTQTGHDFEGDAKANGEAASTLSLLRSETRKREEAEARVAELERAAAAAAAGAVRGRSREERVNENHAQAVGCEAREFRSTVRADAGDGNYIVCPCVRLHRCGGVAGVAPEQSDSETFTSFGRVDQDKQGAKIMGLVRAARRKMPLLWEKDANGGADWGRKLKDQGGWDTGRGTGGGDFPPASESPASEVASLIQAFEERLAQSVDANNQLRDFCAHLEGLLALHDGKRGGQPTPETVDESSRGCGATTAAGGSTAPRAVGFRLEHPSGRLSTPFAVCRESLARRRTGAKIPGATPFPDVEIV